MPPNRSRGGANDRNQPPAQTPSHRPRPTPSGPSSSTAIGASTATLPSAPIPARFLTQESQESLERRVRAANILDRWEELAWIALYTGESIPQVRLQQERILCGLPAIAGDSEREWEDENEVPWSEVKHLDEKWRKEQLKESLRKDGEGEEGEEAKMKLGENVKFVPGLGGGDGEFIVCGT